MAGIGSYVAPSITSPSDEATVYGAGRALHRGRAARTVCPGGSSRSTDRSRLLLGFLKRCGGMRLVNVYDVNAKTYILKFARNEEKVFILIESGVRIHTTEFFRDKINIPSGFNMKVLLPFSSSFQLFTVQRCSCASTSAQGV